MSQNTFIRLWWANASNTLIVKCWVSHVIYRMLCWKWEIAWLSLYNCHVSYWPSWLHGCMGALADATQPHRRVSDPVSLVQEESKFKTQNTVFNTYCFPTIIKLKNHKLNHDGSGTDYIHSCFWMPWSSMTYSQKKKNEEKKKSEREWRGNMLAL